MLVLGIDPGLKITGYGLVNARSSGFELIEAGVLKTRPQLSLEKRLADLYKGVEEIIVEFKPETLSIEDLYSHYNHPKTAVIMGHARGVFFLAAGNHGIPVHSYSATNIKKAVTGAGHASKDQMMKMICSIFNCPETIITPDVADSIAAAICHINHFRCGK